MNIQYFKEYSHILQREVEFKIFGHAGKPCLVFPAQNGRFFDFENFDMVSSAAEFIETGKLQLFCIDSVDAQSWSDVGGDQSARIAVHEQWFNYVCEEFYPRMIKINKQTSNKKSNPKVMTTGCSMGATHALNFFLRRPDLFDSTISLSGIYGASFFFPDYTDEQIYFNSPIDYLRGMDEKSDYVKMYRNSKIVVCCGQGAWEDEMLHDAQQIKIQFARLKIDAWVDIWGKDVNHDWPWWRKQFPYFLSKIL